ncbi:hypothetical protein CYFUS_004479 [Cystobacter fuscus]|uniref:MalT-like TPR region domain-containing protein n=1 Tax=Cystobacter fuscus TaxID=43 RepID=A0A250J663_9BACT|nr:hypothetical protein [Cystobacter fuscus]ATB39040.1 hypothetical protein CYFUS_004479 [Cystobacter fuscus]
MGAEEISEKLNELLLDVALSRRQLEKQPQQFLRILVDTAILFPVFDGWPSPMDGWMEEAERLDREIRAEVERARGLGQQEDADLASTLHAETMGLLAVRRALVSMHRGDLEGALRVLEAARRPELPPLVRLWEAATRARVHVRRHAFDEAERALAEATPLLPRLNFGEEGIAASVPIAQAELALERGAPSAERALREALAKVPPEWVEERVRLHQGLALALVTRAEALPALEQFERAHELVAAAGIQSEVVLMDLAIGSLRLGLGDISGAEKAFHEALSLSEAHSSPSLEPLLRLSAARARAAAGDFTEAAAHCLRAAIAFAQRGSATGYVGMISFLHSLQLEAKDYAEAYRTLATGLSVSRRLGIPGAEALLRTLVNRMRDTVLGPERFDRMVEELLRQAKQ